MNKAHTHLFVHIIYTSEL